MRHPIVVGGLGGSGTRAVYTILVDAGVKMGTTVSATSDSVEMYHFHNVYLNFILEAVHRVDYAIVDVPAPVRRSTIQGLSLALKIVATQPDPPRRPWGFKCPRSIYVLPFLQNALPTFFFLHVVRDGRDMALSTNRSQLERHYEALFGEPVGDDPELAQARLWNAVNLGAARWASTHMPQRYLVIRYEDLSRDPVGTIAFMMEFIEGPQEQAQALAGTVAQSGSIGRWRSLEETRMAEICVPMREGLKLFGYDGEWGALQRSS